MWHKPPRRDLDDQLGKTTINGKIIQRDPMNIITMLVIEKWLPFTSTKKMGPFNIHNWDDLFLDVSGCFLPRISVDGSPHGFDIGSDGFDVTKHRMGTV